MRLLFFALSILFLNGCSYWKQRNIAIFESKLAAEEKKQFPPEPTLEKKRVDEVTDESLFEKDGLTPAERRIIEQEKAQYEARRKKRRDKMFNFWSRDNWK